MGFSSLRVINEDKIAPGSGFGMHPHRDMEIITYVVEGSLEHKDSMNFSSIIKPGEIQRMSAGRGVRHSEFNPSPTESLHLLQIWIKPEQTNLEPSYQQQKISKKKNCFILIGSNQPTKEVIKIHQDVSIYVAYLNPNHRLAYTLQPKRAVWLQLIKGQITLNNIELVAGDALTIKNENISIHSDTEAELLLFDLNSHLD